MISVEGVTYSYGGDVVALDGVSLEVGDSELLAIVGENGAGKTTLVKHLNGLLKPQKGKVFVGGIDTKETTVARIARKVGLVFQNPDHQLFAETVEKELAFALTNFGASPEEIRSRVEWALAEFSLVKYRDRSPFTLSGGEKKRVSLASVLCYDPEIIVLDEPTTGQDNLQKTRLAGLLTKLNRQGKTVIVVTHDIEFVADFIPRVVVMSRGKIIADGKAEEVLVAKEVMESSSLLPPQLAELSWKLGLKHPSIKLDVVIGEISRMLEASAK
ncbi:MAG: ABC transporter ATP-binding protein [Candidatus Verstraetearchaeota archaeon]|nr:ABC transporter ATP-binding protein [Candidatus Verstraetearchaeota archaeon]